MQQFKRDLSAKLPFFISGILYIAGNLLTLSRFPFVHSDETWLSGLSRNMMEAGSLAVTEPFFDLYPRHPHAIKSLFHTLQVLFIQVFDYQIFSVRLLSFIFGLLTLWFFYKLCGHLLGPGKYALMTTVFLALDVQFLYASHFARQEIMLLFILTFSLYYFFSHLSELKLIHHLVLGSAIGLSIGLHPNSFIISLPAGALYLFHILVTKKARLSGLLIYVTTTAGFAFLFVLLSFLFDPHFVTHYTQFGSQFGVTNPLTSKFSEIITFYRKLYHQISGTYYTPDIRLDFYLFGSFFMAAGFFCLKEERRSMKQSVIGVFLTILAINAGIILIGRFNQTSVIFVVPWFYILITYTLSRMDNKPKLILSFALALLLLLNSITNILPSLNHSYSRYLQEIGQTVKREETVLANLNAEMYFENGKLYDYRNLAYLTENHLTFEQYIRRHRIEYIVYPEEMDLIYTFRPEWNHVYGDISSYYPDMQKFLEEQCSLVREFSDPTYGMRITKFTNKRDWKIRIYQVHP